MKLCSKCQYPVFSKGLCINHYKREHAKPIAKQSAKRKKDYVLYGKAKEDFWADPKNKYCAIRLAGCTRDATEPHHKAGRENSKLYDMSKVIPACHNCHTKVTEDSRMAIAKNKSETRITNVRQWEKYKKD